MLSTLPDRSQYKLLVSLLFNLTRALTTRPTLEPRTSKRKRYCVLPGSFLFIFLLTCFTAFAQTGQVNVTVMAENENDLVAFTVDLMKIDSVISTRYTNRNGTCSFEPVKAGTYSLRVMKAGFVTQKVIGFEVRPDSITDLDVTVYTHDEIIRPKMLADDKFEYGAFSMLIKHPFYSAPGDTAFRGSYYLRFMAGTATGSGENIFQLGIMQGSSFSQHFIAEDSEVHRNGLSGRERITALNYHVAVTGRLNITKNKPEEDLPGLFIDAGAGYSLPLWVRHVTRQSNTRMASRWIHRFNEAYAFARIGYGKIALSAQYSLTDYLKKGYPEPPVFLIGIDLVPTLNIN